ncbi:MAG: hypothetical protein H7293_10915 [Candidatus Saccharibacteria bacterium]|nr:hypothetical protein [Rhodoferax sp.]
MLRNFWIVEAAAQIPAASEFAQSKEMEKEFNNFLSRGPWKEWRDIGAPPPEASKLRFALFHIALENWCGQSLSYKTFYRVLRDANLGGSVPKDA